MILQKQLFHESIPGGKYRHAGSNILSKMGKGGKEQGGEGIGGGGGGGRQKPMMER